jgi:hypothetical protein
LTVYLIFFVLFALFAVCSELNLTRRARLSLFIGSYLLMLFFVGLRWETGNDWAQYYVYYTHATSLADNPPNGNTFEFGYRLITICIKSLGCSYAGFLFIYSAVYLGLMFLSFRNENYTISGWLILQLYAPFIMGLMGTSRQVMSVSICMFSIRYLLSKDWRRFLLCMGIATLFHSSAPAFLLAWPLSQFKLTFRRMAAIIGALIVLGVLNVGTFLSDYVGRILGSSLLSDLAAKYVLEQESSAAQFDNAVGNLRLWALLARAAILLVFLLFYKLFETESDKLYLKLYTAGFFLFVLLSGSVYVLAERTAIYFTIFQMHLLALPIRRIKRPVLRKIYCVFLVVISLVRLWSGIYARDPRIFIPYKGIIINRQVERDLGWFKNDL